MNLAEHFAPETDFRGVVRGKRDRTRHSAEPQQPS
jgi:hypothetical protein